ncbi:MAG TPA: hypothetical protein VE616_13235 [Candidatus Udaeobacter sp.]|jgi:hypothetical protein|nr:hypothetical protein [Candidatus Udaeobacter sp.]
MLTVLQIVTVILVAVAMALALAHALELPGKMRLDKQTYYAVQPIYYPGFTNGGGIGEAGGTIATISLLFLTQPASADFWLTLVALLGLIAMQAVYWLATHPVNKFWLGDVNLDRFSSGFFSFRVNRSRVQKEARPPDWTELRNRWEYSHVARAGCAMVSFIALLIAISCSA